MGLPGNPVDVVQRREGRLFLGRRVTVETRQPEPLVEDAERRREAVARLGHRRIAGPQAAPEPAVLRSLRVLDHHGPRSRRQRLPFIARRRTGVVHLLDDHRAVRQRRGASAHQPRHHHGRVVDANGGVGAEIRAVDVRPGVAHAFVGAPSQLHVFGRLQKREQPIVEVVRRHRRRQRKIVVAGIGTGRARGLRLSRRRRARFHAGRGPREDRSNARDRHAERRREQPVDHRQDRHLSWQRPPGRTGWLVRATWCALRPMPLETRCLPGILHGVEVAITDPSVIAGLNGCAHALEQTLHCAPEPSRA